jgi:hypothetical protein
VTWWLAETVLPLLSERRTAYDIQVGAIPAVVRMQLPASSWTSRGTRR